MENKEKRRERNTPVRKEGDKGTKDLRDFLLNFELPLH
jgi:hypothetical protein